MIKRIYFFALIAILFFTLPVHADYCPSPDSIKLGCKILVTENMVETAINKKIGEYRSRKPYAEVVKNITQKINDNPQQFFALGIPSIKYVDASLTRNTVEQLDRLMSPASVSEKDATMMLVSLDKEVIARCAYRNKQLNLINKNVRVLLLNKIKSFKFEKAYFLSSAEKPTTEGILVRCVYRSDSDGKTRLELGDNYEEVGNVPHFKLNHDYSACWEAVNEKLDLVDKRSNLYRCKGNIVKNCPFSLL